MNSYGLLNCITVSLFRCIVIYIIGIIISLSVAGESIRFAFIYPR